jgi:ADP-ribose pyrophosphatase
MLPNPPRILLEAASPSTEEGFVLPFLKLLRVHLIAHYPNGTKSEPFSHDIITRDKPDAVVILPYFIRGESLFLYLRSAVRPAITQRFVEGGNLWELPAGLIDKGETPEEAAARELAEEVGFRMEPSALISLGTPVFSSVGTMAEQLFFYRVQIDPTRKQIPSEDGSPLERYGAVAVTCLDSIRCMISKGMIADMKTELGIRRLEKLWHVGAL